MAATGSMECRSRLRFGRFALDLERHGLYRGEERLQLTGKPLETLIYLAQNSGRLVAREALLEAIWFGVHVTANTVEHAISEIRHVLAEGKKEPQFIHTISGKGYCFISTIQELEKPGKPAEAEVPSIAVLPFGTIPTHRSEDSIGVGIADAIITRLSNCRKFTVCPTASVLLYADGNIDPRKVGRELGVDLLLEGMVQTLGKQIRLSVQLIRVSNGESLWGHTLDGEFTDLFSAESSIGSNICRRLSRWLRSCQQKQLGQTSSGSS